MHLASANLPRFIHDDDGSSRHRFGLQKLRDRLRSSESIALDVAGTLKLIAENGGKVVAPRFEVKGVVVLGLFADPAGNGMGLVEYRGGKAVIP